MGATERWDSGRRDARGALVAEKLDIAQANAAKLRQQLQEAVRAERNLCFMILKADQGDWDRTVPTLAQYAEARLRETESFGVAEVGHA